MLAMMSTPERERSPTSATAKMAALALTPVSRQIEARLDAYVDLLVQWQTKTNLVASSTLPQLWTRHIADSLQLLTLAPNAKRWARFRQRRGLSRVSCLPARLRALKARASIWSSATPRKRHFSARPCGSPASPGIIHLNGYRGLCGQIGGPDRLRDRTCAGASTSAARLRRTLRDKGRYRAVSQGPRCRS